jgi:hypothetical protein
MPRNTQQTNVDLSTIIMLAAEHDPYMSILGRFMPVGVRILNRAYRPKMMADLVVP